MRRYLNKKIWPHCKIAQNKHPVVSVIYGIYNHDAVSQQNTKKKKNNQVTKYPETKVLIISLVGRGVRAQCYQR